MATQFAVQISQLHEHFLTTKSRRLIPTLHQFKIIGKSSTWIKTKISNSRHCLNLLVEELKIEIIKGIVLNEARF